jgi:hypothetical protein
MKQRCLNPSNPSYDDYGGRGITIYQPWIDSFEAWYEYMGPRPDPVWDEARGKWMPFENDRKNPDGNYEPGNVRWASRALNAVNKRGWESKGIIREKNEQLAEKDEEVEALEAKIERLSAGTV